MILDNCPFCGDSAMTVTDVSNDQSRWPVGWVECVGCHARTHQYYDQPNGQSGQAQANEAWNRRHHDPDQD